MATQDLTSTGTPVFAGVNAPNILSVVTWSYQASTIVSYDNLMPRAGSSGGYEYAYYVPRNGTIVDASLTMDDGVEFTSGTIQFYVLLNNNTTAAASYSSPVRGPATTPVMDTQALNGSGSSVAYIDANKEYTDHAETNINVTVTKGDIIVIYLVCDTIVGGPDGIVVDLTIKWD